MHEIFDPTKIVARYKALTEEERRNAMGLASYFIHAAARAHEEQPPNENTEMVVAALEVAYEAVRTAIARGKDIANRIN